MRPFPFHVGVPHDPHPQPHPQKPSGIKSKSRDIMFPGSQILISGGTFINQNHTSRGMDILMEWVANGAFHDSKELYDAPKCHPHTRIAVLKDIMRWVNESKSAQEDFMMWLFGPAGAGKSAIAKRIAEITAERDLLIGDFFFSKSSSTRNTPDRLIATLAYQLTVSIPATRSYIEDAIERDRAIFNKNILTQFDTLIIKPFQSVSSTQNKFPSQKLIIIDGLDECNDSKAQVAILGAISRTFPQHNLPIKFLLVSRPEPDLVTSFNCNKPLTSIHRRFALDYKYHPDYDIRLFFSDKFKQIRHTHPLKSTIPTPWPTPENLDRLVEKSSGQFIYASTVVKFVESSCHRPSARLSVILGLSSPGKTTPFAELDALYNHLLYSVDDIQITLSVLSFYIITPRFASTFRSGPMLLPPPISPELFLSVEPGDIQVALINLSSILTYDKTYGRVDILHASLVDFLSDQRRSTTFYIDKTSTCNNFIRRILQCVKGPNGIRAGNVRLFHGVGRLLIEIPHVQLPSDILNFDLDAFINASIRWQYYCKGNRSIPGSTIETFATWKKLLTNSGDTKEALDRLNTYLEPRLQIYQSDWRLQLLLTLAVGTRVTVSGQRRVLFCRYVDILLEMDDNLNLTDQNALDLRHISFDTFYQLSKVEILRSHLYVDGDAYASAALHCMRFLSNPPKYYENDEHPEMGLIYYAEWKDICQMTLEILLQFLQQANSSPELVRISTHNIHPEIQAFDSHGRIDEVDKVMDKFRMKK